MQLKYPVAYKIVQTILFGGIVFSSLVIALLVKPEDQIATACVLLLISGGTIIYSLWWLETMRANRITERSLPRGSALTWIK